MRQLMASLIQEETKECRLLFLDCDGVINSSVFFDNLKNAGKSERNMNFDPEAIKLINYINENVENMKVVVSSSWRHHITTSTAWNIIFDQLGATFYVTDVTPTLGGFRGADIVCYLIEQESAKRKYPRIDYLGDIRSFCILDDDRDMDGLISRLVLTDSKFGITKEDADKCIKLLNQDCKVKYSVEVKNGT
jgi:hypothetical protein